jgi:predicted HicB family RNase H-like nuclease
MKNPAGSGMSFDRPEQPGWETEPKKATTSMLIRIPTVAHNMLRQMALDEKTSANKIVSEALNMLFKDRGKPPIA